MTNKRIFGLDLMRAGAVLFVLVSHFFHQTFILGVLGVELFFILSGFLIGGILYQTILRDQDFNFDALKTFWQRRWYRTLPNYFFYLCLYACFHRFISFENKYNLQMEDFSYLVFMQNFINTTHAFFSVSWSLAIEEWFYVVLAGLLFLLGSILKKMISVVHVFYFSIGLLLICPLLYRIANPEYAKYYRVIVVYRLDALMYGVIVSILFHTNKLLWNKLKVLMLPGCILIGYVLFFLPLTNPYYWTLLPMGIAMVLPVIYGINNSVTWGGKMITTIALWSYSLYLSHMLVYGCVFYIFENLAIADNMLNKLLMKAIAILITLVLSKNSYQFIELNGLKLRDMYSK
jgi:peptidoglycan/LPS O-acetylase OafA/YrhL